MNYMTSFYLALALPPEGWGGLISLMEHERKDLSTSDTPIFEKLILERTA